MSILSHLTAAEKRERLKVLEEALFKVNAGQLVTRVSYTDGGHDYLNPDVNGLRAMIRDLKLDLGLTRRARSAPVRFC